MTSEEEVPEEELEEAPPSPGIITTSTIGAGGLKKPTKKGFK